MAKEARVHHKCDLCGEEADTKYDTPPEGWVEWLEDGFIDRTWIEKALCKKCLSRIDEARERAKKKSKKGAPSGE